MSSSDKKNKSAHTYPNIRLLSVQKQNSKPYYHPCDSSERRKE